MEQVEHSLVRKDLRIMVSRKQNILKVKHSTTGPSSLGRRATYGYNA